MSPNKILRRPQLFYCAAMFAVLVTLASCKGSSADANAAAATTPAPVMTAAAQPAPTPTCPTPPPATFSGACAFDQVAKQVSFGPRPPASDAIHRTQDYINSQLKGFGCAVD